MSIVKVNPRIITISHVEFEHDDVEWTHRISDRPGATLYFGDVGPPFDDFPLHSMAFYMSGKNRMVLARADVADLILAMGDVVGLKIIIKQEEKDE